MCFMDNNDPIIACLKAHYGIGNIHTSVVTMNIYFV